MSNPAGLQRKFGFTLLEVLIVVTLIVILALAFLALFNPKFQIEKSWDGKRKKELNTLQKVFEEYYNDKNCYPKPEEVCYDTPQQLSSGNYVCKICGDEPDPSNFSNFKSYLSRLPCDPQHPGKDYLYEVDNSACPTLYRIYTRLSNVKDEVISEVGCAAGCAPEGYAVTFDTAFNYGVTSPNTTLQVADTELVQWTCRISDRSCIPCCYNLDANCPPGITLDCDDATISNGYCRLHETSIACNAECPNYTFPESCR